MKIKFWITTLFLLMSCTSYADQFDDVIKLYGKPDRITSSEKEKPRPMIVTKFVEYKKEGVRFVFVPDAPASTPPPYNAWKLIGTAQDIKGGKDGGMLAASQIDERMAKRKNRK